jgi:predicted Zn-dependent protease
MTVASAYNQLGQPKRLQKALEKLTELEPTSPEAWYDLAAVRASLDQASGAIEALKKALDLNSKRLAQNPGTNDIRTTMAKDGRFTKLRNTSEFKALDGAQ